MFRRNFLHMLGLGGLVGVPSQGRTKQEDATPDLKVGSLDLAEVDVIDTHVHPPARMTLSESYEKWNSSFVGCDGPTL